MPKQTRVGQHFSDDVNRRAHPTAEKDDPKPIGIWPAADEMKNRQPLKDDPPGIENIDERSHTILRNIARGDDAVIGRVWARSPVMHSPQFRATSMLKLS